MWIGKGFDSCREMGYRQRVMNMKCRDDAVVGGCNCNGKASTRGNVSTNQPPIDMKTIYETKPDAGAHERPMPTANRRNRGGIFASRRRVASVLRPPKIEKALGTEIITNMLP